VLVVALALVATGCNALAFGANVDGRLGDGSIETRRTPVPVSATVSFEQVDAGDNHSCGITTDGRLFCWGQNINRQLGHDTSPANVPIQVGEASDWIEVSAGGQHTCGLRAPGRLFCWGDNTERQAIPSTTSLRVLEPTQIGSSTVWDTVSAGQLHTCAIQPDFGGDALFCWGFNDDQRLGNGSSSGFGSTILPIDSRVDWTDVDVSVHTCALRRTGEMNCWGRNEHGQLGTGDQAPRLVPTPVATGDWDQVSAGERHTCGTQEGSLWCWGRNVNGQLGDGSFVDRSVPTPVAGGGEWDGLSAGGSHTCGIQDSRALCWGSNAFGAIGDGSQANRGHPVHVATEEPVFRVAAGRNHTLLVRGQALP
jgi:alpha-tubulin suppressor-like RCC1 family protein